MLLFVIIALAGIVTLDIKTNNFTAVIQEKEWLDKAFGKAIDDASLQLVKTDGSDGLTVDKDGAVNGFYQSVFSALNISDNPDKQKVLQNYTPAIAVTADEGYYIYYNDEYKGSDGLTYYSKRWSEMLPYYYEDSDFIYTFTLDDILTVYDKNSLLDTSGSLKFFTLNFHDFSSDPQYQNFRNKRPGSFLLNADTYTAVKKTAIINSLEKTMTYYCNRHNRIARQYGITYNFAMPIVDNSEWSNSIDNPSIIVIFQGYPYGEGLKNTYNRFNIAGSHIVKSDMYYLEQKSWYFVYHIQDCPLLQEGSEILTQPYYSKYECIKKGAYACPVCNKTGVYPPDYDTNNRNILIYSLKNWNNTMLNLLWGVNKLSLTADKGNLIASIAGPDPYFSLTYPVFNTEYVDSVMVYAKITGTSNSISQLFFSTKNEGYTEVKSVRTNISADNEWQWIEFKVSDNPLWKGDITNFRFDIVNDASSSGQIEIGEIKFRGK